MIGFETNLFIGARSNEVVTFTTSTATVMLSFPSLVTRIGMVNLSGSLPCWRIYLHFDPRLLSKTKFLGPLHQWALLFKQLYWKWIFDFLSGLSISICYPILLIPTTSSSSFRNLNKASTTHFCNPPKRMHFLENSSILGVAFIWALKSKHIGLERPNVLYKVYI